MPKDWRASWPVMVLDPRPHQRVLDLCAAPGSKTSQIAMHMNNQGILKANEPIRQRLYRLKSVLQLTGAQAQISSTDGRRLTGARKAFLTVFWWMPPAVVKGVLSSMNLKVLLSGVCAKLKKCPISKKDFYSMPAGF